MSSAIQVN